MSDVEAFRATYRQEHVKPGYSGGVHLVFTTCGALLGIGTSLALVQDARPLELLTIPLAFVFANVVEYLAHRWLMHVPRGPLKFLYERHTLQHHRFFAGGDLAAHSSRDFLLYEWCHLLWHQPPASPFGRLRIVGWMRSHHLAHHVDDARGFNVTLPLTDAVLGPRRPR